jgi:hypothetical protein
MLMLADMLADGIAKQFPGKGKADMGASSGAPQKATAGHRQDSRAEP